jgi:hypothetical protein
MAGQPLAPHVVAGFDARARMEVECVVKAKEEPMT